MIKHNKAKSDRLYEQSVERFAKWAETCHDIPAAVIVGSRARLDPPADEWADLDIVLVTTNPQRYITTTDWIEKIGKHILTFVEPTATGGEMERRVLFEGMLDADFAIIPRKKIQHLLQHGIPDDMTVQMLNTFGRGIRVILDKDGQISQFLRLLLSIKAPTPKPPTQDEFLQVTNNFLHHVVWTAKHLRRGELWWAKMCCNCFLQGLLLRMVEWHSRATHGWNYGTWFRGRFLEKWADPIVLKGLRGASAHYDEDDLSRALLAALDLFRTVATDTAKKLDYRYLEEADVCVTRWVKSCLSHSERIRES